MKEDMYTYHYYQNRTINRPSRVGNFVFPLILLLSIVYILTVTIR